jgi:hypothetical protein
MAAAVVRVDGGRVLLTAARPVLAEAVQIDGWVLLLGLLVYLVMVVASCVAVVGGTFMATRAARGSQRAAAAWAATVVFLVWVLVAGAGGEFTVVAFLALTIQIGAFWWVRAGTWT